LEIFKIYEGYSYGGAERSIRKKLKAKTQDLGHKMGLERIRKKITEYNTL